MKQVFCLERPGERLAALVEGTCIRELVATRHGQAAWTGSVFLGRILREEPDSGFWFVDTGLEKEAVVPDYGLRYAAKIQGLRLISGTYMLFEAMSEAREAKGLRLRPFLLKENLSGQHTLMLSKAAGSEILDVKQLNQRRMSCKQPRCILDLRDPSQRLCHFHQLKFSGVRDARLCDIEETIRQAWLDSAAQQVDFQGGCLLIEATSAVTAIDVNGSVEAEHLNLQACACIAEEVMRRNLAGQILVDFAGMSTKKSRRNCLLTLQECFKNDQRKISWGAVDGFSCLIFSRQRHGMASHECRLERLRGQGVGWVESDETIVIDKLDQLYLDCRERKDWARQRKAILRLNSALSTEFFSCIQNWMQEKAFVKLEIAVSKAAIKPEVELLHDQM